MKKTQPTHTMCQLKSLTSFFKSTKGDSYHYINW